jgi:hypothetical protein
MPFAPPRALRRTVPMYPELAAREPVANAQSDQDFAVGGAGPTTGIFTGRMEIANPGVPLADVERFLDTPPRSAHDRQFAVGFLIQLKTLNGDQRASVIKSVKRLAPYACLVFYFVGLWLLPLNKRPPYVVMGAFYALRVAGSVAYNALLLVLKIRRNSKRSQDKTSQRGASDVDG